MNTKKRAVLYVRVSTEDQGNGHSPEAQESKLRAYCKHNSIEVVKVYLEEHSAKSGFNRPAYKEFLADLKSKAIGKIDLFLVTQYSRFSRNLVDSLKEKKFLKSKSIDFIAIEQPINDNIPEDFLLEAIYLALPQVEIHRLSLRTKDGLAEAKQKGCFTGKAPFGFRRKWFGSGQKKLAGYEQHPLKAQIIIEIFNLFIERRYDAQEIRLKINKKHNLNFSRNEIYYILKNKAYCGLYEKKLESGEIELCVSPYTEPIITVEQFNEAQSIFKPSQIKINLNEDFKEGFILHKILFCSTCNHPLTPSNCKGNGGTYGFYECKYRPCVSKSRIRKEEALKQILKKFQGIVIPTEVTSAFTFYVRKHIDSVQNHKKQQLQKLNTQITIIEKEILNLNSDYHVKKIQELDKETYLSVKNDLNQRKTALLRDKIEFEDIDLQIVQKVERAGYILENLDKVNPDGNEVPFRSLVRTITVGGGVCEKGNVRTKNSNPFIDLMRLIAKEALGQRKRSKPTVSTLSLIAPSPGLEPGTP